MLWSVRDRPTHRKRCLPAGLPASHRGAHPATPAGPNISVISSQMKLVHLLVLGMSLVVMCNTVAVEEGEMVDLSASNPQNEFDGAGP